MSVWVEQDTSTAWLWLKGQLKEQPQPVALYNAMLFVIHYIPYILHLSSEIEQGIIKQVGLWE